MNIVQIYHVETQEHWDSCVKEVKANHKITNEWQKYKESSCLCLSVNGYMYFSNLDNCKKKYPNIPIIEYKADEEWVINHLKEYIDEVLIKEG